MIFIASQQCYCVLTDAQAAERILKYRLSLFSFFQNLVRWMNGSCIECPPQKGEEEEVVTVTFYNDISLNPQIIEQALMIPQNVHRILANLTKYLRKWKKYRPLWKLDKAIVMEKFAAKKPPCVAYDEKLQFYTKIAQEVMRQPLVKEEHCVRLQLGQLAHTVQESAKAWVASLGKLLNESAREELHSLYEEMEVEARGRVPPARARSPGPVPSCLLSPRLAFLSLIPPEDVCSADF